MTVQSYSLVTKPRLHEGSRAPLIPNTHCSSFTLAAPVPGDSEMCCVAAEA